MYWPTSPYDWIEPLTVENGRLVLHDRTSGEVVVRFDPRTMRLARDHL